MQSLPVTHWGDLCSPALHPKTPLELPPGDTGSVIELQAAVDTDHFGFSYPGTSR